MTAALIQQKQPQGGGLMPIRPVRDLKQVADLIELCFASSLNATGRAAIGEMKAIAQMGPLLWLLYQLDNGSSIGRGYVWRDGKNIVGNASLYRANRHPWLGSGWMVANVAVHPDYRRRGIARELMEASLLHLQKDGAKWAALQVEADNEAARQLYETMGFDSYETLGYWESRRFLPAKTSAYAGSSVWQVGPRRRQDAQAELDLIFTRARLSGTSWTRAIDWQSITRSWPGGLDSVLKEGYTKERYALSPAITPDHLSGIGWFELSGWQRARISLFFDPAVEDPAAKQALTYRLLSDSRLNGRQIQLETHADDVAMDSILLEAGLSLTRRLVQMRYHFT